MLQGWRWYGPNDPVSLDDIRQAGATDVVTALHQVPIGEAWTRAAVEERKAIIENSPPGRSPLTWSVVESIPIPDDVKRLGRRGDALDRGVDSEPGGGGLRRHQDHLLQFHACRGLVPHRSRMGAAERRPAMRFDQNRFAAFDLHILQRPGAGAEYSPAARARAKEVLRGDEPGRYRLHGEVIASALPGSTTDPLSIPQFRDRLEKYAASPRRCCASI